MPDYSLNVARPNPVTGRTAHWFRVVLPPGTTQDEAEVLGSVLCDRFPGCAISLTETRTTGRTVAL